MGHKPQKKIWHLKVRHLKKGDIDPAVDDVQGYLVRFRYLLEPYTPGVLDPATSDALACFQRVHKLTPSGELDQDTAQAMERPRCGFPADEATPFALLALDEESGTYNRRAFTYRFINGTVDLPNVTERQARP